MEAMTSDSATPYPTSSVPGGRFPMAGRWQEGYEVEDVDRLCARAQHALSESPPSMGPVDIRAARFTPVRMRAGYTMGAVDSYLDVLAAELDARLQATSTAAATVAASGGHCPGCRCAELGLRD